MQKILGVKFVKGKANGKGYILVTTPQRDHWIPLGMFRNEAQTDTFDAFVGGSINVNYYQKGDKLLDESICDADDIIVESINLAKNPDIVAKIAAEEQQRKSSEMDDLIALNKRKRDEKLAKIKAALETEKKDGGADNKQPAKLDEENAAPF